MKSALFAAGAFLVFADPSASFAQSAPKRPLLPNFDQRALPAPAAESASAEQKAAAEHLRALVPQVKVDFDPVTGAPKCVAATDGFLTGANGAGKAVSAAVASKQAAGDPYGPTKAFLQEHSRLFGHGDEALGAARIKQEYVTPHNGLRTVVWEQQVQGIGVFEGVLISHTTKRGELVSICSQFLPDAAGAASRGLAGGSAAANAPGVSARQAVALAAQNVGETLTEDKLVAGKDAPAGAEQRQKFSAPGLKGEADAKLAWLPLDKQTLRLCWDVTLMSRARGEMFRLLVDASSGKVLLRRCLTSYLSEASYRVFTSDSPTPFSPGYSTPGSTQPPLLARTLVTLSALDTNASPAGWINDGDNQTLGNNVDAHTDWNADNLPDLPRPQGSPARVFDFPMDLTSQDPTTYASAAVVQLFYLCNVYHDRLYQLGFTEAAGNFQTTNFNRGGLGNDAVQADAQDGSGVNNANFSTPPDGSAGRMQMYIFTGPSPRRDGDLDAEVVFHEHTHGVSWRLVGGGQALGDTQSDGLGEGWSDFYSLSLLSEAGDDVNGNYACGAYASYQIGGAADTSNYYFGIRRYPYTTDLSKNPLTFKDIDPAQADYCSSGALYHTGMFGTCGAADANEVHNEGEVWCVTLWQARANLINKLGWAAGNQLMLQLATDGMKLTPAHPNFLQARDAILQADLVDNGGANLHELWAGFAKRGLGYSATSPGSSTATGIHEAYDVPDDLRITPLAGFVSRGPVGGPFTLSTLTLVLTNAGSNTLNWVASNTNTWLSVAPAAGTLSPSGPATSVGASLAASATNLPMGIYNATVWFTNLSSLVSQNRPFTLRVGQPDYCTELFTGGLGALAYHAFTFTPDGSSSFYSVCAQAVTTFFTDPAGGTPVNLTDDSYASETISGGSTVAIYNTRSSVFYIGSNGYLTLTAGDTQMVESATTHFNLPRVSAVFHDLNPASGGSVNWRQLADRVAVTFQAVPVYGYPSMTSSFQIELFFDGRIRLTYLAVNASAAMVGLSAGTGVPVSFTSSDFTSYGSCTPLAVVLPLSGAENAGVLTNAGAVSLGSSLPTNLTVALSSSDAARLTVPTSATILAGQLTASFDLTLVDNALQDGNETVAVTASANGFTNTSASILVIDDDTPPCITIQPASQTIVVSNSVTFSVTAAGKVPLYYFWSRNGHPIAAASASSYTTNNVQLADSGSVFSCLVSNRFGTTLSSNAVLTVTAVPQDWFTEWFSASPHVFDLAYKTFTFTPDGSSNYYAVCQQSATAFPTDPTGGAPVTLSDDSYAQESLSGGSTIALYNSRTNVFFIGSNGYLTLGSGDTSWTPDYTNHFNRPRISALYRDLNPGSAGTISWKQLSDRAAVTYQNVPEWTTTDTNSFQVELFYDGRIRVTYLQIAAAYALVGLSAGHAIPDGFSASDYSTDSTCTLLPPSILAGPTNVTVGIGLNATFTVTATGTAPLAYQWQFYGTNLGSATKSSLTISNAQTISAGSYLVVVTNAYGAATSTLAVLTLTYPPAILRQPANQLAMPGCSATFKAIATGTAPLNWQWQKNGFALSGQTNTTLLLANVQTSDFGTYALVVANAYGSATSSNALLSLDHAPVALPDTIERFASGGVRLQAAALLANDTDPDGDALAITGVSSNSAAGGTVSLAGNWIFYLPPPGPAASDSFTYTVTDGHCSTAAGTVTVQVKATSNPAPVVFIENPSAGSFRISCDGVPGWDYKIQYATDLSAPHWVDVGTFTADAWGTWQFADLAATNVPARFYRALFP
jgi:Fungalysin metallopeptidase (M36)/Bacterial Ig domain/Immunoglobulin domain/Immunoglobulin I-set domain/Fungalysin/Thermolysin Propeptide Motif